MRVYVLVEGRPDGVFEVESVWRSAQKAADSVVDDEAPVWFQVMERVDKRWLKWTTLDPYGKEPDPDLWYEIWSKELE